MDDLKFLGIGGAFNVLQGGNCAYLEKENSIMLIDCAEGTTEKLLKLGALENKKNIYILLSHMHADHVAGLGTFIWQCFNVFAVKPIILANSKTFKQSIINLLTVTGVNKDYYNFTSSSKLNFFDVEVQAIPTTHTQKLECFMFKFKDNKDITIYTGDTNDINYIKKQANDKKVIKIYCEVSISTYPAHIFYNDLKQIENKEKFVLMHFNSLEAYNQIKKDKLFKLANRI